MPTLRFFPVVSLLIYLCCFSSAHARQISEQDFLRESGASLADGLVCPEPAPKETSWFSGLTSITGKQAPVSEKRLSSIKVNTLNIELEMRDANPLFLPGNEHAWEGQGKVFPAISGPISIDQLNFSGLLSMLKDGEERVGVAADGTSQLLIVIRSSVAGTFKVKMLAQSIGDVYPETGEIQVLGGGKTCFTGEEHVAFALYHAPADFGRHAGMGPAVGWLDEEKRFAEARDVWLDIKFKTETGAEIDDSFALKVVRPPVVLVHGLYDTGSGAWVTKSERVKRLEESLPTKTFPELLRKSGFVPFVVDYESSNGEAGQKDNSSFWSNRYVVWNNGKGSWLNPMSAVLKNDGEQARSGGIRQAVDFYRQKLKLAATRADVIGHSMGGVLARVYASDWNPGSSEASIIATLNSLRESQCRDQSPYNPDYRRPDNFGQGDINRLITLGTPHHGSEIPAVFSLLSQEKLVDEDWQSYLSRNAVYYGAWLAAAKEASSAATQDLSVGSCALKRIGPTNIRSHVVVGVAAEGSLEDLDYGSYLPDLERLATVIYYNPELGQELIRRISKDYTAPEWTQKFPAHLIQEFEAVLNAEYENWIEQEKNLSAGWLHESVQKTNLVPTTVIEALRGLIFRFDKNDATVRVDSQTAGLAINSPYVTYIASERDAKLQENILHSFEPRYPVIQNNLVKLLWSNPTDNFIETLPPAGQKMAPHAPPEDFGVDLRLTGSFAKKWSGMDFRHADAFLAVAKKHHVVILSRPVNPDATELIIRGAATKGMNVKGKSSNWGPQKGYIPVDQRYSKLWRTTAASDRDKEIEKFNQKTKSLLRAVEPSYNTKEGEPIAIGRQLKHSWDGQSYSVWIKPEEADAEQSIYLCKGEPANSDSVAEFGRDKARPVEGEDKEQAKAREKELEDEVVRERQALEKPCDCQEWYDWRTAKNDFDLKNKPQKKLTIKNCEVLRPLQVLADNTHPDKEFLTADYDLLTTGFLCKKEKASPLHAPPLLDENNSPINPCLAELKVNTPAAVKTKKKPNDPSCVEGLTELKSAEYSEGTPPKPWPCLDPDTGLITVAQVALLQELNAAVEKTGYTGGNVSHHGPETQFFESPYVDYPITAFDPGDPNDPADQGRILAIPRGPKGFRDLHLKRFYEEKIRQGYWLYPNTYDTANWLWKERGKDGRWRGWFYEDSAKIGLGKDTEQIPPPPCVYREIQRRKVAPQVAPIECTQELEVADNSSKNDAPDPGNYPDWLPKVGNAEDLPPISAIPRPAVFYREDLYLLPSGLKIANGDSTLRAGEYDSAIAKYESAQKELFEDYRQTAKRTREQAKLKEELIKNWGILNHRIMIARGARDYVNSLNPNANFDNAFVNKAQVDTALLAQKNGETIELAEKKSTFPLTYTKDFEFLIKDLEKSDNSEDEVSIEVAVASLAAKLGFRAPQAAAIKQSPFLVSRFLYPSEEAFELKEHQLLAFREAYARQRVFRIWIGDFDGHLRNFLKGPDDRLWMIDFDNANLEGTTFRKIRTTFPTTEAFLEAVIRYPHGNLPDTTEGSDFRDQLNKIFSKWQADGAVGNYIWQARMDRMVRYRDMQETVEKIQAFARSEALDEVFKEIDYGPKSSIDNLFKGEHSGLSRKLAVQSLRERAELLDNLLENFFDHVLLEESIFLDPESVKKPDTKPKEKSKVPEDPAGKTKLPENPAVKTKRPDEPAKTRLPKIGPGTKNPESSYLNPNMQQRDVVSGLDSNIDCFCQMEREKGLAA